MYKTTQSSEKQSIAILQYNLHKCKETTYSVLNDPTSAQYAIIMIQEQYYSNYMKSSLIHHSWTLIQRSHIDANSQPRAATYVNKNLLSADSYEPIHLPINDVVAVAIQSKHDCKSLLL